MVIELEGGLLGLCLLVALLAGGTRYHGVHGHRRAHVP